ncbi:MAG: hypothetical protein AB1597_09480 [Chloroflexota bacterium]
MTEEQLMRRAPELDPWAMGFESAAVHVLGFVRDGDWSDRCNARRHAVYRSRWFHSIAKAIPKTNADFLEGYDPFMVRVHRADVPATILSKVLKSVGQKAIPFPAVRDAIVAEIAKAGFSLPAEVVPGED